MMRALIFTGGVPTPVLKNHRKTLAWKWLRPCYDHQCVPRFGSAICANDRKVIMQQTAWSGHQHGLHPMGSIATAISSYIAEGMRTPPHPPPNPHKNIHTLSVTDIWREFLLVQPRRSWNGRRAGLSVYACCVLVNTKWRNCLCLCGLAPADAIESPSEDIKVTLTNPQGSRPRSTKLCISLVHVKTIRMHTN